MSDNINREWKFYIEDMIDFCEKALEYTESLSQDEFIDRSLILDATVRNLELIGESATHIPDKVRESHPEIPCHLIIATRNQLIHGNLGIDYDTI